MVNIFGKIGSGLKQFGSQLGEGMKKSKRDSVIRKLSKTKRLGPTSEFGFTGLDFPGVGTVRIKKFDITETGVKKKKFRID